MAQLSDKTTSSDDESAFVDIDHLRSSPGDVSVEDSNNNGAAKLDVASIAAASDAPTSPQVLKTSALDAKMLDAMYSPLKYPAPQLASDEQKREAIRQHLSLLIHASECYSSDGCSLPYCSTMKEVLQHRQWCSRSMNGCCYAHCNAAGFMMHHHIHCNEDKDCWLCTPVKMQHMKRYEEEEARLAASRMLDAENKKNELYSIRKSKKSSRGKADRKKKVVVEIAAEDQKKSDETTSYQAESRASFKKYFAGLHAGATTARLRQAIYLILFVVNVIIFLVASPVRATRVASVIVSIITVLLGFCTGAPIRALFSVFPLATNVLWLISTTSDHEHAIALFFLSTIFTVFFFMLDKQEQEFFCDLALRLNGQGAEESESITTEIKTVASKLTSVAGADRIITLPSNKLGLIFFSEDEKSTLIYQIIPCEAAEKQGGLKRGDMIKAVNGFNVKNKNATGMKQLVQSLEGPITLRVYNDNMYLERVEQSMPYVMTISYVAVI